MNPHPKADIGYSLHRSGFGMLLVFRSKFERRACAQRARRPIRDMTDAERRFSSNLPADVQEALYQDYPTYRAVIFILDRLARTADLEMHARLAKTPEIDREHPILSFFVDDGRVLLFRMSCTRRLYLRFATRTDLQGFLDEAAPTDAITGKDLAANPKGYPLYFEKMTSVRPADIDYVRAGEVLAGILSRSPARRVVRRPDDSELEALLREINRPQDEYMFDQIIEDILDRINEDNFDTVMNSLAEFDPHAEDEPDSVPGMKLILMNDLVRERGRLLRQTRELLPSVKAEFERLGEFAKSDLQETEALIAYIDGKLA